MPDDLDEVLNDIWARWGRGSADRRSPFHTPVVGSIDENDQPNQRVMVLRKAERASSMFRFHSDVRSTKVNEIGRLNAVSIVGYDYGAKIQLRARGTATIVTSGPVADAAWATTSLSGRRSYLTILPPGTPSDEPTSGLDPAFERGAPSSGESDEGRQNFGIVVVALDSLEWLHLAATGHRRAAFLRVGDDWVGTWLIP